MCLLLLLLLLLLCPLLLRRQRQLACAWFRAGSAIGSTDHHPATTAGIQPLCLPPKA
jgi:hypothetical protein